MAHSHSRPSFPPTKKLHPNFVYAKLGCSFNKAYSRLSTRSSLVLIVGVLFAESGSFGRSDNLLTRLLASRDMTKVEFRIIVEVQRFGCGFFNLPLRVKAFLFFRWFGFRSIVPIHHHFGFFRLLVNSSFLFLGFFLGLTVCIGDV